MCGCEIENDDPEYDSHHPSTTRRKTAEYDDLSEHKNVFEHDAAAAQKRVVSDDDDDSGSNDDNVRLIG